MALRLEEIELIKRTKYMYCRGIDTADIPLLRSLLTDDIEVDYQGGTYRFQAAGREQVLEALESAFHNKFVSTHTVHHPIIDVHDDDTADGHWTLVDLSLELNRNVQTAGSSFYIDKYVKHDGRWLIRKAIYTRLFERVGPIEPELKLTAHYLGEHGKKLY
jgi:hypothetical protein